MNIRRSDKNQVHPLINNNLPLWLALLALVSIGLGAECANAQSESTTKKKPSPAQTESKQIQTAETVNADSADNDLPKAFIDGTGSGWQQLGADDFQNANCKEDTWTWKDGLASCNGNCVGVIRSKKEYTNFEMVLQWRHLKEAGNSGVFVWSPKSSLDSLKPNGLPHGIEIQVLDHGYTKQYESNSGKQADWFTTNGDVFPVGSSKMKPFEPISPNGRRSFPSANHSKGVNEWNHYYIRAINGEVRLWVNGYEVSGGNECEPATGFIALEAEGAPIEFKDIRLRVLK